MSKTLKVSCPHCRNEAVWTDNPHRPFCSERCRSIDLGNWATERYRIGSDETPTDKPEATPKNSPRGSEE